MWYLISSTNPDVKHVLLVGSEITVGRKDCTVLLTTDPTVSRKHASLLLAHAESNLGHPQKSALLTLKDLSKFGTWVNKKRVNGEALLKDGDEITFGSPKSAFLIVCEPFIITTSCLDQVSKRSTKVIVRTFGGFIVSEWVKSCNLLVMNSISVTIKVICALITQKSIVLPGYLEKLLEYHKGNSDKPKPEDYQPPVSETQVNAEEVSFNPNPNRSSVFKGMKFIFLSQKQFKKMNLAVELAGGMPILMEEGSDDNDDRVLVEPGTVVMNVGMEEVKTLTPAGQEWVVHVGKYLKRKKKNFIQDAEIGYAVLFCSTEKHCNPDIDKAQHLFQHVPSQSLSQCAMEHSVPDVLVANTETSPGSTRRGTRSIAGTKRVVDESVLEPEDTKIKQEVISQSTGTPAKRKRNDHQEEAVSLESKRIKQEIVTPAKSEAPTRSRTALKHDPGEIIPDDTDVHATKQEPDESMKRSRGSKKSAPKSRSPSPSPSRRSTRIQKSSPAREVIETSSDDADIKRTRGNRKRELSPKPTTSKTVIESDDELDITSKSKNVQKGRSHAIIDDDDDNDNVTITKSTTKVKSELNESSSKKPASQKPKKKDIFDDSDDEDIGLWQRNKRKRKMEETSKGDNSEDEMDIPSSKTKKETRDSDGDDLFDVSPKRKPAPKRNVVDEERNVDSRTSPARSPRQTTRRKEENEERNTDSRRSPSPAKSPARPQAKKKTVKREIIEESDEEAMVEHSRVEQTGRRRDHQDDDHDDGEVPSGFLTTNIPIKKQEVKRSDFVKENMPTSVIVTRFVDLVAKRPTKNTKSSKSSGRKDIPDGYCEWNGKLVKNFKRFKKTSHAGSNYLPRIIGGSDLVVYTSNRGKEMGDWFNEATQNESQYARDREEQDLFDLDMPVGRTKRSR